MGEKADTSAAASRVNLSAALSQAILATCAQQSDCEQLLETLAAQVQQWFGCLAVGFFSQRFDTTPSLADGPLLYLAGFSQPGAQADAAVRARLFTTATQAVGSHTLYRQQGQVSAQVPVSPEEADARYDLLALALETAGTPAGAVALASGSAAFTEEHVALLESLHPALALAFSYALNRKIGEQARRKQEQLEAIFTNSSEGVLTVDAGYRILELNPAFTALTGWPYKAALGRTCMEVLQCRDERDVPLCKTKDCPLHQAFTRRQPIPYYEVAFHDRQGHKKEIAASFTAVHSREQALLGVIIARDMTVLNAANRTRSNFISMVSHELRTPLNTVSGFLSIVQDEHVGPLNARQSEFLGYVRSSTDQLITLVNDILFVSKADTGQFELRCAELDLADLIAQVIRDGGPSATKLDVRLHGRASRRFPKLWADAGRLHQVLMNLIHNALKFTPPGGSIAISARRSGEMAEISVVDTGCGVPFEDQSRVFERFYQSENALLVKHGGFGLGLTIVKLIVEQHGGRIWLESEPEHGSTFHFTIPLLMPRVKSTE
ncbi:MAG TPA: PAS domain-containing sensor histidine kinase [Ktedonobacterales bacterium]|nr:PAS domain-containing sensor histidine kinase [Ktedonobacterales bacterium]